MTMTLSKSRLFFIRLCD